MWLKAIKFPFTLYVTSFPVPAIYYIIIVAKQIMEGSPLKSREIARNCTQIKDKHIFFIDKVKAKHRVA